jgi:hypothetical protein
VQTLFKCALCLNKKDVDKILTGKSINICHECYSSLTKKELDSIRKCQFCETDDALFVLTKQDNAFAICVVCLKLANQMLHEASNDEDSIFCQPKEKG